MSEHYEYDILVLGNGFDRAIGLPTSYSNFYEAIRAFDNCAGSFDSFWKAVFESFGGARFNQNSCLPFYDLLKKCRQRNYFVAHLMNQVDIYDNWCDLESEIKEVLLDFDYVLDHINPRNNNTSNFYEFPLAKMNRYVMFDQNNVPIWRGFEFKTVDNYNSGMVTDIEYSGPFDLNHLKARTDKIKATIVSGLRENLNELKELLRDYLNIVSTVKPFDLKWNIGCTSTVTYNYTDFSKGFILDTDEPYHIHGKLDSDIILGIDDLTDFKNHSLEQFTKSSQRASLGRTMIKEIIQGMRNFAYYGLSFDCNDKNTLELMLLSEDAIHNIYYYKDVTPIAINLQKILGKAKYNEIYNEGRLNFIECSEAFSRTD